MEHFETFVWRKPMYPDDVKIVRRGDADVIAIKSGSPLVEYDVESAILDLKNFDLTLWWFYERYDSQSNEDTTSLLLKGGMYAEGETFDDSPASPFSIPASEVALCFVKEFGFMEKFDAEFETVNSIFDTLTNLSGAGTIALFEPERLKANDAKILKNLANDFNSRLSIDLKINFKVDKQTSVLTTCYEFRDLRSRFEFLRAMHILNRQGKVCRSCGKLLSDDRSNRLYCKGSDKCRNDFNNEKKRNLKGKK